MDLNHALIRLRRLHSLALPRQIRLYGQSWLIFAIISIVGVCVDNGSVPDVQLALAHPLQIRLRPQLALANG